MQMKLYTEEQVRIAMSLSFLKDTIVTENQLIDALKSIKLPSDEEIEIQSYLHNSFKKEDGHLLGASFRYGAKWVIEQIKQQAYV